MTSEASVKSVETDRALVVEVCFEPSLVCRQWEELEPQGSAFQTRTWLLPWYRVIAPKFGAIPLFVTVRDQSSGRPLMFFPLCLRRKWGIVTIEFADFGVSDYNALILAPDLALSDEQARTIWDDIRRSMPSANLIRFDKIPEIISGRFQSDRTPRLAAKDGTSLMGCRAAKEKRRIRQIYPHTQRSQRAPAEAATPHRPHG